MLTALLILVAPLLSHILPVVAGTRGTSAPPSSFHVYRSDDHGVSWIEAGAGLPQSRRIHALAVEGSTAYAGTDDGVFVSVDGGRTWSARFIEQGSRVQCFTVAGRRVYAGTRKAGVFVTEDRGRSWRQAANGSTGTNVRSLASRGPVVYAGTDSQGVFVLPEGRERWSPFGEGLPERPQVFDLAVKGRQVYAALYSKGLYRLEAGGGRWEQVGDVTPLKFLVRGKALLAGHNPGGIYRSVDDGATWHLARGLSGNAPIWVLGNAGPNVLAGTSPGAVALSDDFGASWRPSTGGLPPGSAVVAIGGNQGYTLAAVLRSGG